MTRASPASAAPRAPLVIALEPVVRDPQRVRVKVRAQGSSRARVACIVLRDRAQALRVRVGLRWTGAIEARLRQLEEADDARDDALRAIARARQGLSASALEDRLRARGHSARAARAAVRQLRGDGWISDRIREPCE